jgi:voltage-gated sodium channel
MQEAHAEESNEATEAYRDEVLARLSAIEERLAAREGGQNGEDRRAG